MDIYEAFGWIALALNIWGNLGLANKSIHGWLIRLACNVAFIIYSFAFGVWPLFVNHIIFSVVNIYGWIKWSKDIYKCSCGRKWSNHEIGKVCICEKPIAW